ncbi:MAG: hypothetical protein ABW003_19915 [Microvirga sp.]
MKTIIATPARPGFGFNGLLAAAAVALIVLVASMKAAPQAAAGVQPPDLRDTGLYADFEIGEIDARHLAFSPQYPLWTDGATKRRWISLPPGSAIDASDPDAWVFPVGTRLWKEFSFEGRRVETRVMERQADGQWRYAAYAWSADWSTAQLVPERGKRGAYPLGGGRSHTIPGVNDCKACHQGGRGEVLGFGLIQLAPDLDGLIARGLLVGLPPSARAVRWTAASTTERAAAGYLHGNCGHCHNEQGPLRNLALFLRQTAADGSERAIASTFDQAVKKPAPGLPADAVLRIEPEHPERSALLKRIASRYPPLQMPPLGTELIDRQAVDLLSRWIAESEPVSPSTHRPEKGPTQ